jgi:glycosyltransferase involved in cell wall biosynthesis
MTESKPRKPSAVLLLIRSLHIGGAERQVVSLAKSMTSLGTKVHVGVKVAGGPLESDLRDIQGVELHHLGEPSLLGQIRYFLKLRSLIRSVGFDAVYGFMPLPNLALLVSYTVRNRPLIAWGVRSSDVDESQYGGSVKWTMRLEKWLSRFSNRVITNSEAALEEYRTKGYPYSKLEHIPNAINVDRFKPNSEARAEVISEFGVQQESYLIGIFARIHPMKDHMTFLKAAKVLVDQGIDVTFLCAGETSEGYSDYESRIRSSATAMGLDERVLWIGPRQDPEMLMAACDLTTLTSDSGEGFPNSVAESLACGIPCVSTDIGDAKLIIGDYGTAVSRGGSSELADAWKLMVNRSPEAISADAEGARKSIVDRFSPESIAERSLTALSVNVD